MVPERCRVNSTYEAVPSGAWRRGVLVSSGGVVWGFQIQGGGLRYLSVAGILVSRGVTGRIVVPNGWSCYLCVGEQEYGVQVLNACDVVQLLEVLVECCVVVASAQLYLEATVSADVRRQSTWGGGGGGDRTESIYIYIYLSVYLYLIIYIYIYIYLYIYIYIYM